MKIITITTYFIFTMYYHSSMDQTTVEIRSCIPYCAIPGKQQSKQSAKISTTTTFLIITEVNYSKYQTRAEIISCTPYCATPCDQ